MQKHWYLLHWVYQNKDSDYVKIQSVNPSYLIIGEVDGFIKEKNGNKYLTLFLKIKTKKYW